MSSTVRAFEVAVATGQALVVITNANAQSAMSLLQHSAEVLEDIRVATQVGYTVTIPQRPVQVGSWRGAGYTVADPLTGSTAYRISGGANGGSVEDQEVNAALGVTGLGIPNVQIAAPKADTGGCDGDRQRQHQIDWVTILMAALLLTILIIIIVGSDGAAGPALSPVVKKAFQVLLVALVTPILPAMAGTQDQCFTWYVGTISQSGLPMNEFQSHIAFATGTKSPKDLIYDGVEKSRGWLSRTPECSVISSLPGGYGAFECDEYPFNKTLQGGEFNYPELVSLRPIAFLHNRRGGGAFSAFLMKCRIPTKSRIRIETTLGSSRFEKAPGVACGP